MSDLLDMISDDDDIRARLDSLRREHQALDDDIDAITRGAGPLNFMELQRKKKRKLSLKDMIIHLENQLVPDIIA
jgi:hypothetical protein